MKRLSIVLCLCGVATAASLHFQESAFVAAADGAPPGWSVWSARPETAPRVFVDPLHYRTRAGSLGISGNSNGAEHGGWERRSEDHTSELQSLRHLACRLLLSKQNQAGSWLIFRRRYRSSRRSDEHPSAL